MHDESIYIVLMVWGIFTVDIIPLAPGQTYFEIMISKYFIHMKPIYIKIIGPLLFIDNLIGDKSDIGSSNGLVSSDNNTLLDTMFTKISHAIYSHVENFWGIVSPNDL